LVGRSVGRVFSIGFSFFGWLYGGRNGSCTPTRNTRAITRTRYDGDMKTISSEAELQVLFTRFMRSSEGRRWLAHANEREFGFGCAGRQAGGSGLKVGGASGLSGASGGVGAFELKLARGTPAGGAPRLRLGQIEDHQVEALRRAWYGGRSSGVVHKISDMGFGAKPFDCFVMDGGVPAWVVVGYVSGSSGVGTLSGVYGLSIMAVEELIARGGTVGLEDVKRHGVAVPL
jgi:hypothetical protein